MLDLSPDETLRLECLRLAVQMRSEHRPSVELAAEYVEYVKPGLAGLEGQHVSTIYDGTVFGEALAKPWQGKFAD